MNTAVLANVGLRPQGQTLTTLDPLGYAAPDPDNFFSSERFALMTGLQLIGKGGKQEDFGGTDRVRLLYLEVPVYALYQHELPNKGLVFGGLGPYFGYGLSGKYKSTFNGQTTSFDAFDKDNGGFRRFDGGLAFTAGYRLPSSLQFRLAYELGLANIETGPDNKTTNRALSVSVGYSLNKLFGKKSQ
ncbi:MAG: PorT family protein [Cytophagaceae bacterium]|nr:PorT family protein [Cytophagaceae bacterium]